MKKTIKWLLIIFLFLLACEPSKYKDRRSAKIKASQKKTKPMKLVKSNWIKPLPVFNTMRKKEVQTFYVNPSKDVIIGKRGTRLSIYEDILGSLRKSKKDKIKIELIEAVDSLDLFLSGVPLVVKTKQGVFPFESAGMFSIQAYYKNKKIQMPPNRKIHVFFPNVVPGDKFYVYKINQNGEWERHGHNNGFNVANLKEVGVREYIIDEMSWWNWDIPVKTRPIVLGGKVNTKEKYQVIFLGTSFKGYTVTSGLKNQFHKNLVNGEKYKVLAVTEGGDIGHKDVDLTRTKSGSSIDIGEIEVSNVDKRILENKTKFANYFGLKQEAYKVNYTKPGK